MNFLRKYAEAKDKKIIIYLVMLAAAGALLMLWGRSDRSPQAPEPENQAHVTQGSSQDHEAPHVPSQNMRAERAIEEELEEFFSLVQGAGKVRVMISALGDRETVFAVDSTSSRSHIIEEDAQGGTRDQRQYSTQEQTVIIRDQNGIDQPLILREISPSVQGIVIIAEGGDDPFVRDALTRAAMAVLGVEAHRVQVLTMDQ